MTRNWLSVGIAKVGHDKQRIVFNSLQVIMKEIKELLGVVFLTILTLGMAAIPFFLLGLIYGFIGYVAYKTFMFFAG